MYLQIYNVNWLVKIVVLVTPIRVVFLNFTPMTNPTCTFDVREIEASLPTRVFTTFIICITFKVEKDQFLDNYRIYFNQR